MHQSLMSAAGLRNNVYRCVCISCGCFMYLLTAALLKRWWWTVTQVGRRGTVMPGFGSTTSMDLLTKKIPAPDPRNLVSMALLASRRSHWQKLHSILAIDDLTDGLEVSLSEDGLSPLTQHLLERILPFTSRSIEKSLWSQPRMCSYFCVHAVWQTTTNLFW